MFRSKKRIIFTCLGIFVGCLCLGGLALVVGGWLVYQQAPQLLTGNSCAGVSNPDPPLAINAQMDLIENQVTSLRSLSASSAVKRGFLTYDELHQHVLDDFFKNYTAQDEINQEHVLAALGLLPANFDLQKFYVNLYSEQIAGYYDQDTKNMYVIQQAGFGGSERMTYAHEYTHFLQDQNYDIRKGLNFNDTACKKDSERCAAISALLEGDATSIEQQWFGRYATRQDCQEVTNFYLNFKSPIFDSAPAYMKQDFLFPYLQGKDFVQRLLDSGGEKAVDGAFANTPKSTEQILHPERYPSDAPLQVDLPTLTSTLGTAWEEIDRGVMGEWYTYLILAYGLDPNTRLDEATARQAAAGWGGDRYAVLYNQAEQKTALVLKTTWDTLADAAEFSSAFLDYAGKRFGAAAGSLWQTPDGLQAFFQQGQTSYWISAPDQARLSAIKTTLGLP